MLGICDVSVCFYPVFSQPWSWFLVPSMPSLHHILMGRNGDYFLNYIDYSKKFDAVLKLLLVILGNHQNYCSKYCILGYY